MITWLAFHRSLLDGGKGKDYPVENLESLKYSVCIFVIFYAFLSFRILCILVLYFMYSLAIHIGLRNKHWLDILVVFVMLIPTSPPPSSGPCHTRCRRPPTHMYLTLSGMLKVQTNFHVDHLQHSISHPSWRKFQLKWYIMMSATSLVFYSMLSLPSTLPSTTKPHEQKVGKWGIIEKDFQRASQCSMPVVVGLAWVLWGVGGHWPRPPMLFLHCFIITLIGVHTEFSGHKLDPGMLKPFKS